MIKKTGYHCYKYEDDSSKRKVGRPFKGDVDEFSKEPNVPERRSILRGFKKFYAKKEYEKIDNVKFLKEILSGLTVQET